MQIQKLQEDLRESERRFNLLQKRLDFANGMVRQLQGTLAISHGDKSIIDWLACGATDRKLKKIVAVLDDPTNPLHHADNLRATLTAIAKEGV